jgi:hypothetical protein
MTTVVILGTCLASRAEDSRGTPGGGRQGSAGPFAALDHMS